MMVGNIVNEPIRNQTGDAWQVYGAQAVGQPQAPDPSQKTEKTQGAEECQTCKNRRYQDGSNDPGVSFKSPTKMSPGQAASAVFSHEREHYTREEAQAKDEGREVVSNDIQIFTAVCPECGKVYVAGGETRTTTRKMEEQAPFAKQFFDQTVGPYLKGQNVNATA